MAETLPEEIIFYEILNRLCVKYLIRLTVVCKRWLSVIKKPGIINSFLDHTSFDLQYKYNVSTSIVVYCDPNAEFTVLHNNDSGSIFKNNAIFDDSCSLRLIDSVHGLVCFYYPKAPHLFFIWNPVTNFFKTVVKPSVSQVEVDDTDSVLGYDSVNRDIKIMQIQFLYSNEKGKSLGIHVYSCNTESWKEIKDETLPMTSFRIIKSFPNCAYLHFNSTPTMLVAFDFNDEVFKQLRCWEPCFGETPCYTYINWRDSLSIVVNNYLKNERVIYTLDEIRGTWSQQYIVPDSTYAYELELGLKVVDDTSRKLLLFQGESSLFKILMPRPWRNQFHVIPYTESLIYIKGMHELNTENINRELIELNNEEN